MGFVFVAHLLTSVFSLCEVYVPASHHDAESESFIVMCVVDGEAEEEPSTSMNCPLSPAESDVSISRWALNKGHVPICL